MNDEFLEAILNGEVILFLGAGFSRGATNIEGQEFKTGQQLQDAFAERIDIPQADLAEMDLHDLADEFVRAEGPKKYLEFLKSEFTVSKTTDIQQAIAALPWRRVYTTNYDLVFEQAASTLGIETQTFDLRSRNASIVNGLLSVVHLNGIIDRCDEGNVVDWIKLTFGANLSSTIAGSSCGYVLQEDLAHAKGCVVLGFTAPRYDIDITRLFVSAAKRESTFFFSGTLTGRSKRNVDLVGIDSGLKSQDFIQLIEKFRLHWSPKQIFHPLCLEKFIPQLRTLPQTGIDEAFRFFALGDIASINVLNPKSFLIQRKQCQIFCDLLCEKRVLILHSFFGNGKTILSYQIGATLSTKGWEVYRFENKNEEFYRDIDYLASSSPNMSKYLVIIEEFSKHPQQVEYALRRTSEHLKLMLTDRTSAKELVKLDLEAANIEVGDGVAEIACDRIESDEIQQLIAIFDRFGLWQKKIEPKRFVPLQSPEGAKLAVIRDDCKAEFQNILLHVMKSPQMQQRLESLFLPLYRDLELRKVVISLCILILRKISLSTALLNSICGNVIFQRKFLREDKIHQLIDFVGEGIRFRSAITAEYVINNICDFEYFFEILAEIFWKLDELNRFKQNFSEDLGALMTFSVIERITPDKFTPEAGKSENEIYRVNAIIKYIEAIKDSEFCSSNRADLYLQLAISYLAKDDLINGEAYLAHAQNFAYSSRMKYKVANQVSRLLLAKAVAAPKLSDAWPMFSEGRTIIEDQMQTYLENEVELEYPFARAAKYLDFVKRFGNSLSREQLDEILTAVQFVAQKIEELPKPLQKRRRVKNCSLNMKQIRSFFNL